MDYENVESNEVADITVHERSFSWRVDDMIKSETASNSGASDITFHERSFSWRVDNDIRSSCATEEDLGASPLHTLTSVINRSIRSSCATEEDLGASPLHTSASAVDNAMSRSSAAPFSQLEVVPNATRLVPARLFTLAELEAATNNFSLHNNIRYDVYRGKLVDGREVAINKRIATSWGAPFARIQQQKQQLLKKRGEEEISSTYIYERMTCESVNKKVNDIDNLNMLSSKAVDEACGENPELEIIGLDLQDYICRDLIEEIVRELGCFLLRARQVYRSYK